jgi:hypothetical protein
MWSLLLVVAQGKVTRNRKLLFTGVEHWYENVAEVMLAQYECINYQIAPLPDKESNHASACDPFQFATDL